MNMGLLCALRAGSCHSGRQALVYAMATGDRRAGQRLGGHSRGCRYVELYKAPYGVPPLNPSWDGDSSEHYPVPNLKKIGEAGV